MLILNRNVGESIKIGDDITITVVSTQGTKVLLGFQAPEGTQIDRQELAPLERPSLSSRAVPDAQQN